MGLQLTSYSAWNGTDGMDASTGYDSITGYDGTQDASDFWDHWIATHFSAYTSNGNRVSPNADLSSLNYIGGATISWQASVPTSTTLNVYTSVDGGNSWQSCTNVGQVSGLDNTTGEGKLLATRIEMSTSNALSTPTVDQLEVSIQVGGNIEYVPQGVFMLSAPTVTSKADGTREVMLQGDDKWHQFDGQPLGTFQYVTTIQAGTNVATAIQTLAQQFGETKFAFDPCSVTVPGDYTYQPGESVGKAIKQLADIAVYSCFYDVNGYLRFRPTNQNLTSSASTWTYDKNDELTIYAGSDKTFDESKLYNSVLVIGGSTENGTVSAVASITDSNNPLSTSNIGTRLFAYNNGSPDPLITTTDLAQARANYELQQRARIVEEQKFTALPNYLQEAEDVVTVIDDWTGTNGLYQIVKLSIPLKPGETMSGECWRVYGVGY